MNSKEKSEHPVNFTIEHQATTSLISIMTQTCDFLIVDKPMGISVQNEKNQLGLLHILCAQLETNKLWLVHRLDKTTSGLLLLAKTAEAATVLSEQFAHKKMNKTYLALSDRQPKRKQGKILGDMKKIRHGNWALSRSTNNPAHTHFFSDSLVPRLRAFILKPYTGKTHQIRVAMKSLGARILGDSRYAGSPSDRCYLHAYSLSFSYKNQSFEFVCPPTQGELFLQTEMQQWIEQYHQPESLTWPKPLYINPAN
jgi:tRNA pseudouridine32 synthase/23S rRNA pseudouridine746 synthase